MEFVSKQQAYEGLRKLMLQDAASSGNVRLEDMARNMAMQGDHSAQPDLYQRYLDTIKSDPLSPQNALAAAAEFLETNAPRDGSLARDARAAADNPESQPEFWNRWIGILESV